jgi:lipase maturation factor 1
MSDPGVQPAQPSPPAPGELPVDRVADHVARRSHLPLPTYRVTRQLYLRGLGLIYLIAFLSLWAQIDGLIGSKGLLPVRDYLDVVRRIDPRPYAHYPTLVWLSPTDGFLLALCVAGVVLSLLVITGIAQAPALALLWVCYLSLTIAGQDFLSFQWDILLLEAGLISVFFAPLQLGPRLVRQPEPSPVVRWLLWWLLFRLMFLSGVVKLTYGDPSWWNGTAMNFHYLTQPLPTWTSWYAYQLPPWMQFVSVWGMFAVEVGAPLLIPFGTWPRRLAFVLFVAFQLLITATGNYGFFNLLTIVLCIPLLDDSCWQWLAGRRPWRRLRLRKRPDPAATPAAVPEEVPFERRGLAWPIWVIAPLATVLICLTAVEAASDITPDSREYRWPAVVTWARAWSQPFRSTNAYGLFRVMTDQRDEVIIEGSRDGIDWQPYEFKWKPGDPNRRPAFATPHMPRLDWQIWTPFLGGFGQNGWMVNLVDRLLHGEPKVLALLAHNPFPDAPPKYIRIQVYRYRFSTPEERARTGAWWQRYYKGEYAPEMRLRTGDEQRGRD